MSIGPEREAIWEVCEETVWFATNHAMALRCLGPVLNDSVQNRATFIHTTNILHTKLISLMTKIMLLHSHAKGGSPINEEDWEGAANIAVEAVSTVVPLRDIIPEDSPQNALLEAIAKYMKRYNQVILDLRPPKSLTLH